MRNLDVVALNLAASVVFDEAIDTDSEDNADFHPSEQGGLQEGKEIKVLANARGTTAARVLCSKPCLQMPPKHGQI